MYDVLAECRKTILDVNKLLDVELKFGVTIAESHSQVLTDHKRFFLNFSMQSMPNISTTKMLVSLVINLPHKTLSSANAKLLNKIAEDNANC